MELNLHSQEPRAIFRGREWTGFDRVRVAVCRTAAAAGLLMLAPVRAETRWHDDGPADAVLEGEVLRGISSVRLNQENCTVIIHGQGAKLIPPSRTPVDFLRAWGFSEDEINSALSSVDKTKPLPNRNWAVLPQAEKPPATGENLYDPWQEIWEDYPKPTIPQVLENPAPFARTFVRLEGVIAEMSCRNDDYFLLLASGDRRIWVAFTVLSKAAKRDDGIRLKFETLCRQPQDLTQPIVVVGEVGRFADTKSSYVELVDFRMEAPVVNATANVSPPADELVE